MMQPPLKRCLVGTMMVFALAGNACSDPPISPAPPPPPNPQTGGDPSPSPSPSPGGVVGAIEVTSKLTVTGAYEYTIQVRLTEQAGLVSEVRDLSAVADCDCGPMGPFGPSVKASGPTAWIGDDNHIDGYGTLTSKPLVVRDDSPDLYAAWAAVDITYSDGSSSNRTLSLIAQMPPHPDPPTEDRIRFDGIVKDSSSKDPVAGVLVKVVTGPDAGRETRTDALGRFTFEAVRTGRFRVRLNKPGYSYDERSIFIVTSGTQELTLKKG